DRTVLVERHVADLPGLAVHAAEEIAPDDEAGADGVADADEDRRRRRAPVALARLGKAAEVRLAVGVDRAADARRETLGDVDALPAPEEAGSRHHARARVDGSRQRE